MARVICTFLLVFLWTSVCLAQKYSFSGALDRRHPNFTFSDNSFPMEITDRVMELTTLLHKLTGLTSSSANGSSYDKIRMFDASGKPGSGILQGNTQFIGDFDECLLMREDVAHYCLYSSNVTIHFKATAPINFPGFHWGLCVNSSFTEEELNNEINAELKRFKISSNPSSVACYKKLPFGGFAIFVIVFLSVIGIVVLTSTIYDVVHLEMHRKAPEMSFQEPSVNIPPKETDGDGSDSSEGTHLLSSVGSLRPNRGVSKLKGLFFAFSMARNLPKLLETNVSAKNIQCLHGIRALSMFWVILGHAYIWYLFSGNVANPLFAQEIFREFSFQVVSNAFFAVDTFFFLSGLLVMYLAYQKMEATVGHFPWISYYVHRYWRLTPTYFVALLILWQLYPHFADGPFWTNGFRISTHDCDSYWWTNVLYINNFHPNFSSQCMGWTWYLANDMQMYILSPVIIIAAYMFGVAGLLATAGVALAGVFVSLITISAINDFPANGILSSQAPSYQDKIYGKFYTRASPYIVGLLLGYCLARHGQWPYGHLFKLVKKFKWLLVPVAWVVAFAIGLLIIYGLYGYNRGTHYPEALSVLYISFSTFLWAVALSILVFLCYTGYGGIINSFLCWNGWVPLSRLTYSAYLLHPIVLSYIYSSSRSAVYISHSVVVFRFVGTLGLSYLFALLLSLSIEYPCAAIEKLFRKTVKV